MDSQKGRKIKLSKKPITPRAPFAELSDTHKGAIFHYEACRKLFDDRIKDVRIAVSHESMHVIKTFATILPELSDRQLNLSDIDGEYEQLIHALTAEHTDVHATHPGIFLLMCHSINQQAGKVYAANLPARALVFKSCQSVLKAIKDLETPIRNAAMKEFYENATQDELDDIRMTVKHRENPQGHGIPGNGDVPQFRM